jgi:hypothetical protein
MEDMALRKSPVRTRAMLAANRANAQKSTGPSTAQGKARVALTGLKHGGLMDRLSEKLLRASDREDEGLCTAGSGRKLPRPWVRAGGTRNSATTPYGCGMMLGAR